MNHRSQQSTRLIGPEPRLEGLGGNDEIFGSSGDDFIRYAIGDGDDRIFDFNAADSDTLLIVGASSSDATITRTGGAGDNVLITFQQGGSIDLVFQWKFSEDAAEDGIELIQFVNGGVTETFTRDEINDIAAVELSNGNDNWFRGGLVFGFDGNDTISGAFRSDFHGGAGNDSLTGGTRDDKLDGGSGRDTLKGGDGNDSLRGGERLDFIQGGEGDDTYFWGLGDGAI